MDKKGVVYLLTLSIILWARSCLQVRSVALNLRTCIHYFYQLKFSLHILFKYFCLLVLRYFLVSTASPIFLYLQKRMEESEIASHLFTVPLVPSLSAYLSLNVTYSLFSEQGALQEKYKEELYEAFQINFNNLLTITNMPIKRFADFLFRYSSHSTTHFSPISLFGISIYLSEVSS